MSNIRNLEIYKTPTNVMYFRNEIIFILILILNIRETLRVYEKVLRRQ